MVVWVTAIVFALNLVLYTAYDKKAKGLSSTALLDVVTFRQGLAHTLVEVNKVLGLAGLTLLALAFVPLREVWLSADALAQDALLLHALVVLALHSAYSLYKYYGETHIPLIQTWPGIVSELYAPSPKIRLIGVRKLSNLTASLGLGLVLWLAVWSAPLGTVPATALAAIALGTLHFYTMEVDFRLVLGVRPFGFAPFYIAGATSLTLLVSVYLSLKP